MHETHLAWLFVAGETLADITTEFFCNSRTAGLLVAKNDKRAWYLAGDNVLSTDDAAIAHH